MAILEILEHDFNNDMDLQDFWLVLPYAYVSLFQLLFKVKLTKKNKYLVKHMQFYEFIRKEDRFLQNFVTQAINEIIELQDKEVIHGNINRHTITV